MKTNTYLSLIMLCCLLLSTLNPVKAQLQTRRPGAGASAAEGCLACAGSEWNDANKIKKRDGKFASTFLQQQGFCFQSTCYFSRGLIASDFGFSLPNTATINGVRVQVIRKADTADAAFDSAIQLFLSNVPSGDNKKSTVAWPLTPAPVAYGSHMDTWGLTLTPADVNNSDFGFWLQVQNESDHFVTPSVDFVRMTIYFSENMKQYEQTSFAGIGSQPLKFFPNPLSQNTSVSLDLSEGGQLAIVVMNENGQVILEENETVSKGTYIKNIDLSGFPQGIYLVQCTLKEKSWKGFVVKD